MVAKIVYRPPRDRTTNRGTGILPVAMNEEVTARAKFSPTDRMSVPLCSNFGIAEAGYHQRGTGILPIAMNKEETARAKFNATDRMSVPLSQGRPLGGIRPTYCLFAGRIPAGT